MKVYGNLERAQLEAKASDYAATITGIIWFNTVDGRVKIGSGSLVKQFLLNDDKIIVGTSVTAADNVRVFRGGAGKLVKALGDNVTAEGSVPTTLAQETIKLESYTTAGRPAAGQAGRLIWNTDEGKVQQDNGSAWVNVGTTGASVSVDTLEQKGFAEHVGVFAPDLLNSVYESFAATPIDVQVWLMENYVDPATTISCVINPTWIDSANKNFDGVVGWTAFDGEVSNVNAEAGTIKLGATAPSFDKSGGASAVAGIYLDVTAAAAVNLGNHAEASCWVNMPSVTSFNSFKLRIAGVGETDVATNFREYSVALNSAGGPIIVGWNHLIFNIAIGQGSATGTGYTIADLARVFGIFVVTNNPAQTYTNVIVDSFVFNNTDYAKLAQIGDVFPGYDSSNILNFQTSGSLVRGIVTIAALGNNFDGGTATTIKRCTGDVSAKNLFRMTNGLSGDIAKKQTIIKKYFAPSSIPSADWEVSISQYSELFHTVSSVDSTTQVKVSQENLVDYSAQFKTGDKYLVFEPLNCNGKTSYAYRGLKLTLSNDSSFAANLLTLQNSSTNAGVAVNDVIVKEEVLTYLSTVSKSTAETFGSALEQTTVYLADIGNPYPAPDKIYGHWRLGGTNGFVNIKGPGENLTQTGTTSQTNPFMNGFFAAGPFSATNKFRLSNDVAPDLKGDTGFGSGKFSISFQFYPIATPAGAGVMMAYATANSAGNSWVVYHNAGGGLIWSSSGGNMRITIPEVNIPNGSWHNIILVWEDNVSCTVYVDGVRYDGTSANHVSDTAAFFSIGNDQAAANPLADAYIADVIAWEDYKITASEALSIYRDGFGGGLTGVIFSLRHRYEKLGTASVQKISMRVDSLRQTDDVDPQIDFFGAIKR